MASAPHSLNFITFNQDHSCLAVGTSKGFRIYHTDPFAKIFSSDEGNITIIGMLFSTPLVALIMSPRHMMIQNTKRSSVICELTFPSAVLAVRMNRKRLAVVLESEIYIYDIANMALLHTIATSPNPSAICALPPSSDACYLAYPMPKPRPDTPADRPAHAPPLAASSSTAAAAAAYIPPTSGDVLIFDCLSLKAVNVVEAHRAPLSCIALSPDGSLLATASETGTIIRVFAVPSGQKLFQFRRGTYPSTIYSMSFNLGATLLCVSSTSDTIHIFRLAQSTPAAPVVAGTLAPIESPRGRSRSDASDASSSLPLSSSSSSSPSNPTPTKPSGSLGGILRRSSVIMTRSVAAYLPQTVTEMWEPARDFAYIKIPKSSGLHSGGNTGSLASSAHASASAPVLRSASAAAGAPLRSVVAMSSSSPQVMVVTSDGGFYVFNIDMENGGEGHLVKQFSILDGDDRSLAF
ncbi:hypothetical protein TD95_004016 [Thielaviopsis punctulata]|uniref:Autophagy-related protein 18 n=1 Tax=Thielaviopsis punctulata TaxID=72032 RepID=A0A0F4Z7K7_9PEZI|nr:hypothetical protein TD95_004016 [Thielaviopsis punctulata]